MDYSEEIEELKRRVTELERKLLPKQPRASQIDPNFQPSEKDIAWATDKYGHIIGVNTELDKFIDYFRTTGKRYIDWDAAFRNWCRKAAEFAKAESSRSAGQSKGRAAQASEINRERAASTLDQLAKIRRRATRH